MDRPKSRFGFRSSGKPTMKPARSVWHRRTLAGCSAPGLGAAPRGFGEIAGRAAPGCRPKPGRFSIFSKLERRIQLLDRNVVGHILRDRFAVEDFGSCKVDLVKSRRQRSKQDIIAGINEEKINASRDSDDVIFG